MATGRGLLSCEHLHVICLRDLRLSMCTPTTCTPTCPPPRAPSSSPSVLACCIRSPLNQLECCLREGWVWTQCVLLWSLLSRSPCFPCSGHTWLLASIYSTPALFCTHTDTFEFWVDLEPSLACDFQVPHTPNAGSSRGMSMSLSSTLIPAVSSCFLQHETLVSLAAAYKSATPSMAHASQHIHLILKLRTNWM